MSKSLDLDHDRHSVCPDLGPNCLQRLSADNKVAASKEIVNTTEMYVDETKKRKDSLIELLK